MGYDLGSLFDTRLFNNTNKILGSVKKVRKWMDYIDQIYGDLYKLIFRGALTVSDKWILFWCAKFLVSK